MSSTRPLSRALQALSDIGVIVQPVGLSARAFSTYAAFLVWLHETDDYQALLQKRARRELDRKEYSLAFKELRLHMMPKFLASNPLTV